MHMVVEIDDAILVTSCSEAKSPVSSISRQPVVASSQATEVSQSFKLARNYWHSVSLLAMPVSLRQVVLCTHKGSFLSASLLWH